MIWKGDAALWYGGTRVQKIRSEKIFQERRKKGGWGEKEVNSMIWPKIGLF